MQIILTTTGQPHYFCQQCSKSWVCSRIT